MHSPVQGDQLSSQHAGRRRAGRKLPSGYRICSGTQGKNGKIRIEKEKQYCAGPSCDKRQAGTVLYAQAQTWKSGADAAHGPRGEQEGKTASYSIFSIYTPRGCCAPVTRVWHRPERSGERRNSESKISADADPNPARKTRKRVLNRWER